MVGSKIKKDIISVISGRVFTSGLYFLFIVLLMAFMTVEDYGRYTYYYSIIAMIPFFMDLGTNNAFLSLGAKKLSQNEIEFQKYKNNYLAIKYSLFLIFLIVVSVLFWLEIINKTIYFVLLVGVAVALIEFMANLLAVRKQFNKFSFLMPVRNILTLVILGLFFLSGLVEDFNAINGLVVFGIATFCSLFVYTLLIKDIFFKKESISISISKELCSYSSWLVVYGFCVALMMRIDIFIIEFYSKELGLFSGSELGYFSAAFSLSLVLPMIANSIVKVVFPNISQVNSTIDVDRYFRLVFRSVIPVIMLVFVYVVVISTLVHVFFYEKYGESLIVFYLISFATAISFFTNLIIPLFYAHNKTLFMAKLGASQLLVNLIASFFFIYYYGAIGAAISVLVVRIAGVVIVGLNLKIVRVGVS